MLRMGCVLLGLVLGVQPASAIDGLSWTWDAPRRFLLISDVNAPEFLLFQAEKVHQARVYKWRTNVVVSCVGEPLGKKAYSINCKIEDISLQARALRGDEEIIQPVLNDLDSKLTGATIQIEMTRDGRIRDVDLDGIPQRHRRMHEITETMRLVLSRSVAALDLQLPKNGDDEGAGRWRQKQTLVTAFPSDQGTMGSVKSIHEVKSSGAESTVIMSTGKGVAGSGRTIEVAGQEQVANMYEIQYAGESTFDRKNGSLLSREYQLRGTPTSSSENSGAWQGQPYLQYAKLIRLDNGEKPNVGESRPLAGTDKRTNLFKSGQ